MQTQMLFTAKWHKLMYNSNNNKKCSFYKLQIEKIRISMNVFFNVWFEAI